MKCWMEHLWEFTYKHAIEIDDEVGEIDLLRERDSTLTQHFAQAEKDGKISLGEWQIANKCRLYKQVITVADVATGDGNRIDEWVFDRNGRGQVGRTRQLNWPEQGMPSKIDWKVWIKVLSISLCKGDQNLIWKKLV